MFRDPAAQNNYASHFGLYGNSIEQFDVLNYI